MPLHYRKIVREPLASYVDVLWISEGYAQPHERERLMPSSAMGLIVDIGSGAARGMGVAGPRSKPLTLATTQQRDLVGVQFKPGCGHAFFEPPAGELLDTHAPLELLWGPAAFDLRDRLLEARSPQERFAIVERELLAQLAKPGHPAVGFALGALAGPSAVSIADVTARTGYSARRFISIFRDQVGLAPKLFQRLERFSYALRLIESRDVDWSDVALSCGYFDQAHFIHDFGELSGLTPTRYAASRVSTNHVRI